MDEELTAESPVDTVISIRKDLEEFQRVSSKQELRAALREALKAASKAGEGHPIYDMRYSGSSSSGRWPVGTRSNRSGPRAGREITSEASPQTEGVYTGDHIAEGLARSSMHSSTTVIRQLGLAKLFLGYPRGSLMALTVQSNASVNRQSAN
jgi:hypothetical protein